MKNIIHILLTLSTGDHLWVQGFNVHSSTFSIKIFYFLFNSLSSKPHKISKHAGFFSIFYFILSVTTYLVVIVQSSSGYHLS